MENDQNFEEMSDQVSQYDPEQIMLGEKLQ